MSTDLITNLHFDKVFKTSRVVVVKEINGCDSSFITSCVLGHCVKNKYALLFISIHNSFSHYHNSGLKMNYNLQRNVDSDLIEFYNLGTENVTNLLENKENSLENSFFKLKEKILIMKEKHDTVNLIIDGISHLFDLGYTLKEVNKFCKEIIKLIRCYNNTFALFHCNDASDDDVTHVMANLLSHMSYTIVEVENLTSGLSADVSGHLTVKHLGNKFNKQHVHSMDMKHSHYLFKLFDRGVKLFAPGTI